LEVDVRRVPPSDTPASTWTDGDTNDANDYRCDDEDETATDDWLDLVRTATQRQFATAHLPLPALQYRVHNDLCHPRDAERFGLDSAAAVGGTLAGYLLATDGTTNPHHTLSSLATELRDVCVREWHTWANKANVTYPCEVVARARVAGALWDTDDEEGDEGEPSEDEGEDEGEDPSVDIAVDGKATEKTVASTTANTTAAAAAEALVCVPCTAPERVAVCGEVDAPDAMRDVVQLMQMDNGTDVHVDGSLVTLLVDAESGVDAQQRLRNACEAHQVTYLSRGIARLGEHTTRTWVTSAEVVSRE
jgi:hypothetical protein